MSALATLRHRLPLLLCGVAVYLLASPATQKLFTNNEAMVGYFTSLGIPAPAFMVIFVGAIELLAMLAFITGLGARVMAAVIVVEMLVAMATSGVVANNIVLILSAICIAALGTPYALRLPAGSPVNRLLPAPLRQR